jgi:PTH1 family peptidyl-tRNA hydrolase
MHLFVGLGNPGAKYTQNRHNIGFMALDRIAADHGFAPWRAKFQALVSEGRLGGEKVTLLKPQTFMNLSGQSVGEAMRFYKLESTDITVFQDEIDLAPAKCRVKDGGGHAGHNGLRSLHQHIGPHYSRVRLGVGHPGHKDRVAAWVLSDFAKSDQDWLDDVMRGVSDGAAWLAQGDTAKFMNAVGLRTSPQRASDPKPGNPKPGDQKQGKQKPAKSLAKPPAPAPTMAPSNTKGARDTQTDTPQTSDKVATAANVGDASTSDTGTGDTRSALQRLMDKFR